MAWGWESPLRKVQELPSEAAASEAVRMHRPLSGARAPGPHAESGGWELNPNTPCPHRTPEPAKREDTGRQMGHHHPLCYDLPRVGPNMSFLGGWTPLQGAGQLCPGEGQALAHPFCPALRPWACPRVASPGVQRGPEPGWGLSWALGRDCSLRRGPRRWFRLVFCPCRGSVWHPAT